MDNTNSKKPNQHRALASATLILITLLPATAFAASGAGGGIFCWVAQYLKGIVGAAALVAIMFWALENIFGMAKLHDIVIRVGVTCGIVIVAALLIANSGLTVSCTGF